MEIRSQHTPKLAQAISLLVVCCLTGVPTTAQIAESVIDFNREVRPILSQNCFQCHGPDTGNRQMGLRLDILDGFFGDRGPFGGPVIIPGNAEESLLYQRVTTQTDALRMPRERDALTANEIQTIRLWIEQGANWESHWAFVGPEQPLVPEVQDKSWPLNDIDNFVLARLEEEGLSPSLEADRATLIRRVSLDLTGLPPTLEQVDAFLNDSSPDAYEKVVDRFCLLYTSDAADE